MKNQQQRVGKSKKKNRNRVNSFTYHKSSTVGDKESRLCGLPERDLLKRDPLNFFNRLLVGRYDLVKYSKGKMVFLPSVAYQLNTTISASATVRLFDFFFSMRLK
ncbi:hypothetical protein CsSME_00050401 [Camellia sinensis var. sinensis]